MLNLTNIEKNVNLQLDVVGYQFPEDIHDEWCQVELRIQQGKKVFNKTDPALETTDLLNLRSWFKCLSENKLPRFAELTFIEPCISFNFLAYHGDVVRISVALDYELKPDFELEQFGAGGSEWVIVFELTYSDFDTALHGIEEAIRRHPVRWS